VRDSGYQNSDTGRDITDKTAVLAPVHFTRGDHVRRESRSFVVSALFASDTAR